jgi:hypothetical protein
MGLFRRKPNPDALLQGLRDIARELAAEMYELSLVNPPRTLAEINDVAMNIFDDVVREYTDHSNAAMVSGIMLATFRAKYIELAGQSNG